MNKQHGNHLKRILIIVTVFFIIHCSCLLIPGLFQWVDIRVHTLFFFLRQSLHGEQKVSPYILLFTLDDAFEKKYRTSGKEREKIAEALKNIQIIGVRTILLDIIFRERDSIPREDKKLVQSTRSSGNIFYPFSVNRNVSVNRNGQPGDDLPEFISEKALWPLKVTGQGKPVKVNVGITPFPDLCRAARGLGGITLFPGSDGIIHRVPLVYSFREEYIPSFILAGICHYYQVSPASVSVVFGKHIVLPGAILPGEKVKDILIPIDNKGQLIINFTGPWKDSITSFSLENILSTEEGTNMLKPVFPDAAPAALVLIGDITTASKDLSRGIFEENYPFIGIIHDSLNTILMGKYLYQPGTIEQIAISLLFLFILILAGFLRKDVIHPSWIFFLLCIYCVITYILYVTQGRLPDIFLHLLAFTLNGILIFYLELREVKKLVLLDDALEVSDVSNRNNMQKTTDPAIMTGEHRQDIMKRLKKLDLRETQIEVAVLLIQGLQYKEIGEQLNIKTTTVGRRINRMYRRLGINNKIEFINIVYRKE